MTLHDNEKSERTYAKELTEAARSARYVSGTRIGRQLARAAAAKLMTPDEIDQAHAAAIARRKELIQHSGHAEPTAADVIAETGITPAAVEWTPSGILAQMEAQDRNRSAFPSVEQSLPSGDRDDVDER